MAKIVRLSRRVIISSVWVFLLRTGRLANGSGLLRLRCEIREFFFLYQDGTFVACQKFGFEFFNDFTSNHG